MEHFYLSRGLGGGELVWVYGEEDYAGGSVETIDEASAPAESLPSQKALYWPASWYWLTNSRISCPLIS
jgi:hypothetical protein